MIMSQIRYRDRPVKWREIPLPASRPEARPRAKGHALELRKKVHTPATDHPWKQWKPSGQHDGTVGLANRATRSKARQAAVARSPEGLLALAPVGLRPPSVSAK